MRQLNNRGHRQSIEPGSPAAALRLLFPTSTAPFSPRTVLTDGARAAVRKLHAPVSVSPSFQPADHRMGFLIGRLRSPPVGAFNGSSIVDARLKPIERHLVRLPWRSAARVLDAFGVDIWLFSNERYAQPASEYVAHEKRDQTDPTIITDFPAFAETCRSSAPVPFSLLQRCERR
jgi:hypothetical protein